MKELPYEVWKMAWNQWKGRKLIHCGYCNGIHPVNELCYAKYHAISKGYKEGQM